MERFVPIAEALRQRATSDPDVPATHLATPGFGSRLGLLSTALSTWLPTQYRTATFKQLDARSEAIAAGLHELGVTPGKKVAMMVPPNEDFFALAFGLLKAAAVPVLIDPGIGLKSLKTCLGEAEPYAFVGIAKAHVARRLLGWCPAARVLVVSGFALPGLAAHTLQSVESIGAKRLAAGTWLPPDVAPSDLAAVLFTSGSTGTAKGVEYQHRQFAAQAELIKNLYGIVPGEMNLATFPPFALFGPALGMSTVIPRMDPTRPAKVNPHEVIQAANKFQATLMFGSPALLDTVSRYGAKSGEKMLSVRRVISAGAPVAPRIISRFLAMLPADAELFTPYGATECLPVAHISSREILSLAKERTGICVGRPAPGVNVGIIRITDAKIPKLAPGDFLQTQVGEIVVFGANVTLAYHNRPEATALAKTLWNGNISHRMGDLGWFDEQGRLWFAGRKAHRVELSDNIVLYSVPVEEVFNRHPEVFRSALVGVDQGGKVLPVVCLELEPGFKPSASLLQAVKLLGTHDPLHTGASRISHFLVHPGFPVDIRHNAKINREQLATWASKQLLR